jgi:hypothetical protein
MRAVVYDAVGLTGDLSSAEGANLALAQHLVGGRRGDPRFVQFGDRGFSEIPLAHLSQALRARSSEPEALSEDGAFEAVRARLLGNGGSPNPAHRHAIAASLRAPVFGRAKRDLDAPPGALLIKVGLEGWSCVSLDHWLASRPDVVPVAILSDPWEIDRPEYAPASVASRASANLDALLRHARAIVAPNSATAAKLACAIRASGADAAVHVVQQPSALADSRRWPYDAELSALPYFVFAAPIEARTNALLMLQIWRELAALGGRPPHLVLAGRRGVQPDQIAPLLDWAVALKPHVTEAPNLSPSGLRQLIIHSRAMLAPAFADWDGALLRDARKLGTRVLASDLAVYRPASRSGAPLLAPFDGLGWRAAILEASAFRTQPGAEEVALLNWMDWRKNVADLLGSL